MNKFIPYRIVYYKLKLLVVFDINRITFKQNYYFTTQNLRKRNEYLRKLLCLVKINYRLRVKISKVYNHWKVNSFAEILLQTMQPEHLIIHLLKT